MITGQQVGTGLTSGEEFDLRETLIEHRVEIIKRLRKLTSHLTLIGLYPKDGAMSFSLDSLIAQVN